MIELEDVPELRDPVMIAAFEGWNDAGEAATAAVDHLIDIWDAEAIAALDPEDYYDFQVNRPRVVLDDGRRRISWRTTRILLATTPGIDRDVDPRPGHRAVHPLAGLHHRADGVRPAGRRDHGRSPSAR